MKTIKGYFASAATLLVILLAGCQMKQTSYASPSFPVSSVKSVLVLPRTASKFDVQIAGRVQQSLQDAGIHTADVSQMTPISQLTATDACRQAATLDFQAVVFADWNSLSMVDCGTLLTAFNRAGSDMDAPGVDAFTKALITYLKGGNPSN